MYDSSEMDEMGGSRELGESASAVGGIGESSRMSAVQVIYGFTAFRYLIFGKGTYSNYITIMVSSLFAKQ